MTSRIAYLPSTIGRKQIMALAGLALCGFVLTHVLGNFLLFVGPEAYNTYSHKLTSNPLIYVAEAGLVAFFLAHIFLALFLTIRNKMARAQGYADSGTGDKKTSMTTKSLWWQGLVVFAFVALHIWTFKYGTYYEVQYDGVVMRDIFKLVVEVFQSPIYVAWYVFSVSLLGFHLSHGLSSSLQTLGINHPHYTPKIKLISLAYGAFVGLGFAAQPLYMMFVFKG